MYTPVNLSFTILKWGLRGSKLYRYVFVMSSGDPLSAYKIIEYLELHWQAYTEYGSWYIPSLFALIPKTSLVLGWFMHKIQFQCSICDQWRLRSYFACAEIISPFFASSLINTSRQVVKKVSQRPNMPELRSVKRNTGARFFFFFFFFFAFFLKKNNKKTKKQKKTKKKKKKEQRLL